MNEVGTKYKLKWSLHLRGWHPQSIYFRLNIFCLTFAGYGRPTIASMKNLFCET